MYAWYQAQNQDQWESWCKNHLSQKFCPSFGLDEKNIEETIEERPEPIQYRNYSDFLLSRNPFEHKIPLTSSPFLNEKNSSLHFIAHQNLAMDILNDYRAHLELWQKNYGPHVYLTCSSLLKMGEIYLLYSSKKPEKILMTQAQSLEPPLPQIVKDSKTHLKSKTQAEPQASHPNPQSSTKSRSKPRSKPSTKSQRKKKPAPSLKSDLDSHQEKSQD